MKFEELEQNIRRYLLLEDKGIIKLLCATVIANRILDLDPTWVFIVSNSSGGKSELLSALSYATGCWEQDDLTAQTLISGAKKGGVETSLIYRMPPNPIMVIKDLTLLLDKDPKEAGKIFSQLRLVYDGKLFKSFGTGEDVKAVIRMGLIAGVTSAIEDTNAKQASMGQRTIKYYMQQPDALEVTRLGIKGKRDKEMRVMMGESFREFLDGDGGIQIPEVLPDLPDETEEDIVRLSEMATAARSGVKRKEFSHDNRIERKELREMPLRFAKQLANLGRAMIIMNNGALTGLDNRILYKIALDSIPKERKEVMMWATRHGSVNIDGLSMSMKLPKDSVKIFVDDLVALDILTKQLGFSNRLEYTLKQDYRVLIEKFEGIPMTNEPMKTEEEPLPEEPPDVGLTQSLMQAGLL